VKKPVRILTISDGEVSDRKETEREVSKLVDLLKIKNLTINSQAVRLFTSSTQPDTAALCSLLQLNNATTSQLIDISGFEDDEVIIDKIVKLFKGDNLSAYENLMTESKVL
jgi:hypothetical protein